MEIEKEENIIVRYIPQYIVIETRYKPSQAYVEPQPVSKTVHNVKHETRGDIESENSFQDEQLDDFNALDDDVEYLDFKHENVTVDTCDEICSKSSPTKRSHNSKPSKLLNEWFMSNLHVRPHRLRFVSAAKDRITFVPKFVFQNPYPTEEQKEALMCQTNMTKVQVRVFISS